MVYVGVRKIYYVLFQLPLLLSGYVCGYVSWKKNCAGLLKIEYFPKLDLYILLNTKQMCSMQKCPTAKVFERKQNSKIKIRCMEIPHHVMHIKHRIWGS